MFKYLIKYHCHHGSEKRHSFTTNGSTSQLISKIRELQEKEGHPIKVTSVECLGRVTRS